ncbi:hypothetical protein QTP88_016805 [Uroleucon formosanum]
MPRRINSPSVLEVKNKQTDKRKIDNNIQAARLIKNTSNNSMINPTNSNSTFEYDDNTYNNMDVGWTQKVNKRNHSDSSEPKSPVPTLNKKHNNKLFITANRYEVLTQTEPADPIIPDSHHASYSRPETSNIVNQIKPPPPIFIKGIIDFSKICEALIELIGVDNFYCKSSSDRLKIQTNPESYRSLIRFLKEQDAQYHKYQLKEDKTTRVVIRNIHPSTSSELIKSELELRLFEVRQVTNVLHKTTKHPLLLFFVNLESTEQSDDIFQLSNVLQTKIKAEEPHKPKIISQCLNCQEYGHTLSYCGYSARCVLCGDSHPSSNCSKPRDCPSKCALCSGNNPANYHGWNVYRKLQRRNKPTNKSNFLYDNVNFKSTNINSTLKESHPPLETINSSILPNSPSQRTYAHATSNQSRDSHSPPVLDFDKKFQAFLTNLMTTNLYCTLENILELNSDHSSVLLTINASPTIRITPPKLCYPSTDRIKFHNLVYQDITLNVKLKTHEDIDNVVDKFT